MLGVTLNENLSRVSELGIYVAMSLYAAAFVTLALQLSRSASTKKADRQSADRLEKVGIWLMIVAALAHGFGVVGRGIAASRVPWANMYEFTITGTFVVVVIFLVAQLLRDVRFLGTFVSGFVTLALGIATTFFYVQVKTLMPALQSYWLVIHVTVAILATAFFNIATGLAIAYLFKSGTKIQARFKSLKRALEKFPDLDRLEQLSYRFNIVGFILWSFTLIAGAIWAERAWHRYWGWDTKEVWTFIIWTIYAGYLHANATRGWSGKRSAWLSLVGFLAIMFNFTIVNLFFKGLHVYSGLK